MKLNFTGVIDGLQKGIKKIPGNRLTVSKKEQSAVLQYSEKIHFFRA